MNTLKNVRKGYDDTVRKLRMKRLDRLPVPDEGKEIRLFAKIRNECERLPYFIKFYSERGVGRYFFVDNDSGDHSIDYLLSQPNTHVFKTKERYGRAGSGIEWINILLRRYGVGHWCVIADADEFFIFPHYEKLSLHELVEFLEEEGSTSMNAILLDMYSDRPIKESHYVKGENPLKVFRYFDRYGYYIKLRARKNIKGGWRGGVRKRVFGVAPNLQKVPFLRYDKHVVVYPGAHSVEGLVPSGLEAFVLHFKFSSDFVENVFIEEKRKEYYKEAYQYRFYASKIREDRDLCLFYEGSEKFTSSIDLVNLELVKESKDFNKWVKRRGSDR